MVWNFTVKVQQGGWDASTRAPRQVPFRRCWCCPCQPWAATPPTHPTHLLVLDQDAGKASCRVAPHRALDVHGIAVPGVAVANDCSGGGFIFLFHSFDSQTGASGGSAGRRRSCRRSGSAALCRTSAAPAWRPIPGLTYAPAPPPHPARPRSPAPETALTGQEASGFVDVPPRCHHLPVAHQPGVGCSQPRRSGAEACGRRGSRHGEGCGRCCVRRRGRGAARAGERGRAGRAGREKNTERVPDMKAKSKSARSISRADRPSWQQGPWREEFGVRELSRQQRRRRQTRPRSPNRPVCKRGIALLQPRKAIGERARPPRAPQEDAGFGQHGAERTRPVDILLLAHCPNSSDPPARGTARGTATHASGPGARRPVGRGCRLHAK